jgi:NADPH:quinone reductase-like Zn-dependent oxidoreductase
MLVKAIENDNVKRSPYTPTMKLYEIRETTGIDALTPIERPVPKPGPGEVLVRVHAVALNYRDLLIVRGRYARGLKLPLVPASDGAGEVVETGPGVTRVKNGDRVAGIFMQGWLGGEVFPAAAGTALGGALDGMLAEYVVLHQEGVVLIPRHLSYAEAAALPCAGVTAWNALTSWSLQPGISVLVQGTGGVSIFALQFAKLAGARVLATSKSDEKLQKAAGLGASGLINYQTTPNWDREVTNLTDGIGVDHIIEVGGPGTLARSMNAVRVGGRISLIGLLSGPEGAVNPMPILGKQIQIQGIFVGSRDMFEAMNRAMALHQLRPVIDRMFAFEEAREALRYMESGAHFGKIVIRV